ncbi:adenylosuccinate lyase [Roseobacteraceae bacterium NS-SX3]
MKFPALVGAAALILLPSLAFAGCAGHSNQAQSCAPGTVWDYSQQKCVKQVSS